MTKQSADFIIPSNIEQSIVKDFANYPQDYRQSSVLFALKQLQEYNNGWLEDKHLRAIAKLLEMEYIQVYEVATFYSMIKLKPVGKNLISICDNISCKLKNVDEIVNFIQGYLKIGFGETSADGLFTIEQAECLAACVTGPAMIVNGKYYENLTVESVKTLLDSLADKGEENGE